MGRLQQLPLWRRLHPALGLRSAQGLFFMVINALQSRLLHPEHELCRLRDVQPPSHSSVPPFQPGHVPCIHDTPAGSSQIPALSPSLPDSAPRPRALLPPACHPPCTAPGTRPAAKRGLLAMAAMHRRPARSQADTDGKAVMILVSANSMLIIDRIEPRAFSPRAAGRAFPADATLGKALAPSEGLSCATKSSSSS